MKKKLLLLLCIPLLLCGCQTTQPMSPGRYTSALQEKGLPLDPVQMTASTENEQMVCSLPINNYLLRFTLGSNGFLIKISLTASKWDKEYPKTAQVCADAFTQMDCSKALQKLPIETKAFTTGTAETVLGDYRFQFCSNEAGVFLLIERTSACPADETALTLREKVVEPAPGHTIADPTVYTGK